MILYRIDAWKDEEECDFSPFTIYRDAIEIGNEFYPSGFDIVALDTDEYDFSLEDSVYES